jgi:hypothetical protein
MRRRIAFALLAVLLLTQAQSARADLNVLESRHYTIHTDLERTLAEDLARRMDAMFDDYVRRLFNPTESCSRSISSPSGWTTSSSPRTAS